MGDPRLDGSHLSNPRRHEYALAIDSMVGARGPQTSDFDPLILGHHSKATPDDCEFAVPGGTYTLVRISDGQRFPLRIGMTTLGRFPENDIVLRLNYISRRHCIIVVHATGGCEVFDTASLNGTRVNGSRIRRCDLLPNAVLELCDHRFVVEWVEPPQDAMTLADEPHIVSVGDTELVRPRS